MYLHALILALAFACTSTKKITGVHEAQPYIVMAEDMMDPEVPSARQLAVSGYTYGGLGGLGYGGLGYGGVGYGGLGYGGYGGFYDENQDDDDGQMGQQNVIRIPGSAIRKLVLKMKESEEGEGETENQGTDVDNQGGDMTNQGSETTTQGGDLTEAPQPQSSKSSDRFKKLLRKYQNQNTKFVTIPHHMFRRLMRKLRESREGEMENQGTNMENQKFITIPHHMFRRLMRKLSEGEGQMENQGRDMENQGGEMMNQGGDLAEVPQAETSDLFRKYQTSNQNAKFVTIPHHLFRRLMRKVSKYDGKFNREANNVEIVKVPHKYFESLKQGQGKIILINPSKTESMNDEE